jgi:hypothetical protein
MRFTPVFREVSVIDASKGDPFNQMLTQGAKAGYVYGFTAAYTKMFEDFAEMLKTVSPRQRPFLQELMDRLGREFHENCDNGLSRSEMRLSVAKVEDGGPTFH